MNLFVWEVAVLSNPAFVRAGAGMPHGNKCVCVVVVGTLLEEGA